MSHNVGEIPIVTDMFSCEGNESWSRDFTLSDFGITTNEQFIITSGQVALSKSSDGANIQMNVYSIDPSTPSNSSPNLSLRLLGVQGIGRTPIITGAPEIIEINFDEPIVVPAGIERIFVTVGKVEDFYNPASAEVFIAGTAEDNGTSWYYGCDEAYNPTPTTDLPSPVNNANFYINVTGEKLDPHITGPITRLTHNVCDEILRTDIHSCSSSLIYWARDFNLQEFGISATEEYVINSGQVGINNTGYQPNVKFNIYKIDDAFPESFSINDLIGSSQSQLISPNIDRNSHIIQVDFVTPIVIPAGVERILVEVEKGIVYGDAIAFIAGSKQDNGLSWQRGCTNLNGYPSYDANQYVSTVDFGKPDANFYINVTGNVNSRTNYFAMNISNICSEFLKEFSIENSADVVSIAWDFGDPESGNSNESENLTPYHDFSEDGIYTITARITDNNGNIETLKETIDVVEPPQAFGIDDIISCEDSFGTGISSAFDLSKIKDKVLGGQSNKSILFIDGSGNQYENVPDLFTNTVRDRETITVRVAHEDNLCCYSETSFDLIIEPRINLSDIPDLIECGSGTNGFSQFNLEQIASDIINIDTNLSVTFFHENGEQVQQPYSEVENKVSGKENIKIQVLNTRTGCNSERIFSIRVEESPIANAVNQIIGCDDNNDGFSESFDTSTIENQIHGNQTGLKISYFDSLGNELPSPLPNPYTNTTANEEVIIARVTNPDSTCYDETTVTFKTSLQPSINQQQTIYACDQGNGFGSFDFSNVEMNIIGGQQNLNLTLFNSNGDLLDISSNGTFQNTESWTQTIYASVENESNSLCYAETSFELMINKLPKVDLEKDYFLCDLEPSISLNVDDSFTYYSWENQNGIIISNSNETELINAGIYTLTVGKEEKGIYCVNEFQFEIIRSVLPTITEVKYEDLSDNNFIEIIADGDGDFEYSIDGIFYQSSNYFPNVDGGVYTVHVRDKNGCGQSSREVTIIDYPKFFTPNNDGFNDYWQIEGISNFQGSRIFIFDRYGKLIQQLKSGERGWDGQFNGEPMPSSDYWFSVEIINGPSFSGHFTLKR